jgi:cyclomaltodextrinase
VLGVARHSETLEEFVVYRQEYGDCGLWIRPAAMFSETVISDGESVARFRYLGNDDQ